MEFHEYALITYLVLFVLTALSGVLYSRIKHVGSGFGMYRRSGLRKSSSAIVRQKARNRLLRAILPFAGEVVVLTVSLVLFVLEMGQPWVFASLTAIAGFIACIVLAVRALASLRRLPTHQFVPTPAANLTT
jgi:hypothetical protein